MRAVVILVSVFVVLLCPHECAVRQAMARGLEDTGSIACCEHCAARPPMRAAEDRAPAAPVDEEDSRPCFCEGAVFDVHPGTLVDDAWEVSLCTWIDDADEQLGNLQSSLSFDRWALPALNGRLTRIEIGSLRL